MEATEDDVLSMLNLPANLARFQFSIDSCTADLRVVELKGEEAISEPFHLDLVIAVEDEALKDGGLLGQGACLTLLSPDDSEPRFLHGVVASIRQREYVHRFILYDVEVVPRLWLLQYRITSRIFQDRTTAQIVEEVLLDAGIPADEFHFALRREGHRREYCVQYRESDFNFISRLLEEEGLFYFFQHSQGGHHMVIADDGAAYEPVAPPSELYFRDPGALVSDTTHIQYFVFGEQLQPTAVSLADYDFTRPQLDLGVTSERGGGWSLDVYDYPGRYDNAEVGHAFAENRLQAFAARSALGRGESDVHRLCPGYRFRLEDHPGGGFNREYLLTRVRHEGEQSQALEELAAERPASYANQFWVVPAESSFRPLLRARKPRIDGVQTAIVTGPEGEEIYCDRFGRVKVRFHWDRSGAADETSSCWVRVSQAMAGTEFGALFTPRVGQEVVVSFIDGDPDRPLITGSVYHGDNLPPYALPEEKTKSALRSRSSPAAEGFNEIRFEDLAGEEELFFHAQRNWSAVTGHDRQANIGNDDKLEVGRDRNKNVVGDESQSIGQNKTVSVGENGSFSVAKNMELSVGEDYSESVAASSERSTGKDLVQSVGANMTLKVGQDATGNVSRRLQLDVGDTARLSVSGDLSLLIGDRVIVDAGDGLTLRCGAASITLSKNGEILLKGGDIAVKGSGNVSLKGSRVMTN